MTTYSFKEQYGKDDPRLGEIIKSGKSGDVVLLGFPFDDGVRLNGGRIGAREGPKVVREFVKKMGTIVNPELGIDLRTITIADAGDIDASLSLSDSHYTLMEEVNAIIEGGGIPFVVGGGNDQSFPNAMGLLMSGKCPSKFGAVNIDAHLDVRPVLPCGTPHSGSPFRLLLENEIFQQKEGKFVEFAAQGHQCSAEHWEYVANKPECKLYPYNQLRKDGNIAETFKTMLETLGDHLFVSFDIDSIKSDDCPGVSCPANIGLTAEEATQMMFYAGQNPKVKLVDVSEFNPTIESYRTGRLVVLLFYYFCMGVASRTSSQ